MSTWPNRGSRTTRCIQIVCGAALLWGAVTIQNSRAARPTYVAITAEYDAVRGENGPIVNLATIRRNDPGQRAEIAGVASRFSL